MSLVHKLQSGVIGKPALLAQLATYNYQLYEHRIRAEKYGPELYQYYQSKIRDLNMSIKMLQLFVDNYESLATKPKPRPNKPIY